jgi:hypothetical protein
MDGFRFIIPSNIILFNEGLWIASGTFFTIKYEAVVTGLVNCSDNLVTISFNFRSDYFEGKYPRFRDGLDVNGRLYRV